MRDGERKRLSSGDGPGLQNRRAAGQPVVGAFDSHTLPPCFTRINTGRLGYRTCTCARPCASFVMCSNAPSSLCMFATGSLAPTNREDSSIGAVFCSKWLRYSKEGRQYRVPAGTRTWGISRGETRRFATAVGRWRGGHRPADTSETKQTTIERAIALCLSKQKGLKTLTQSDPPHVNYQLGVFRAVDNCER